MLLGLSRLADEHIVLGNKMVSHEELLKACAPPIDVGSAGTVRPARPNHQPFSGLWKFGQGQELQPVTVARHPSFCNRTEISYPPYRAGLWRRLDLSMPWRLRVYP